MMEDERRKLKDEALNQREEALKQKEITLMQFELTLLCQQKAMEAGGDRATTPTPKKRKGKFRKRLLKKEPSGSGSSSSLISGPTDFRHNISLTPSRTDLSMPESGSPAPPPLDFR